MPIRMQDRITHEERNQRNIDNIVETARTFFGHWLGNQLRVPRQVRREDGTMGPNNASGIYKYLPGTAGGLPHIQIIKCLKIYVIFTLMHGMNGRPV